MTSRRIRTRRLAPATPAPHWSARWLRLLGGVLRVLGLLTLLVLLACTPFQPVARLDFRPALGGSPLDPRQLLKAQTVPADRLLSVQEAVARAPVGSVILTCQARAPQPLNWGICNHITRKLSPTTVTESPGIFADGVQVRPLSSLLIRERVIVLDSGVTAAILPRLRAEATRLNHARYWLGGQGPRFDCATYQNALQRALGLPDLVPRNRWGLFLPQNTLSLPGVRVLWVGTQAG